MSLYELHRHLDCSIRPKTLAELALAQGIKTFPDETAVREKFWITKPLSSLKECLDRFVLFQQVLSTPEILERVAHEVIEDAYAEGISFLELRYSPRFASELSKIPWEEVLQSFQRGLKTGCQKTGIKAGLICIVSRGHEIEASEQAIDFAISHKSDFIGVDLAGVEAGYPCRLYKNIFQKAHDAGLPITIHAGEGAGAENIWEAIDLLGARRIGHGVRAMDDKELMKRLARDQILIESCPTSNLMTQSVLSWKEHPLPNFLDAGIPCSISTDDPGILDVTMQGEFERCKKYMGMSEADIAKTNEFAKRFSFL